MSAFNTVIQLRRENDYNYRKVENTFIPANGEVCLVDTARDGLRAKIGDGVTVFGELHYSDESLINQMQNLIIRGYYLNGAFYRDSVGSELIDGATYKLYIDINDRKTYSFDGQEYVDIGGNVPTATATVAGVMKLYSAVGQNTDGTMTQKAISDELDTKIEMEVNAEEETLILGYDRNGDGKIDIA